MHRYVPADEFTPESRVNWRPVGRITSWSRDQEHGSPRFTLAAETGHRLLVYVMSATTFRVRFHPDPDAEYPETRSPATLTGCLGACPLLQANEANGILEIDTGEIVIQIQLSHFRIKVFRDGMLVHADTPEYNLVYIPGAEVVANFKAAPEGSRYFGFGEKGGITLDKRRVARDHFTQPWVPDGDLRRLGAGYLEEKGARLTFFNFDNYGYSHNDGFIVPSDGEHAGPLNPNVPLYQSSPFIMEYNPAPTGEFSGSAYACGILFDNTAQTFVNLDQGMEYYFGALYGELDYYLFAGGTLESVLDDLTQLTGRTRLKPRWVFGNHQGGYGPNYNHLEAIREVARDYRANRVPIDGIHIDVDVQDNFRNFTVSEQRFPNFSDFVQELHDLGYKWSTNVTPFVSINEDENGQASQYPVLESGLANGVFVSNQREDGSGTNEPFIGNLPYNPNDSWGHYPDFGKPEVQQWWGQLYRFWVGLDIDMIWQDMTTPALVSSVHESPNKFRAIPNNCEVWDNEESRFGSALPSRKRAFAEVRNLYNYNLCKATFDGLESLRGNLRNFIIARGGFAGVHRVAGIWTGDNTSNWEFVLVNIPQVLNMGLSGQPVAGADIGGFGGAQCDGEMLTRWTLMGAFLPWFRNHYGHHGPDKTFQEPYRYNGAVLSVCRQHIELRYKLIQVFYDAMHENARQGLPIVRPLFMHSQDANVLERHDWHYGDFHYRLQRMDDQFFLGKDILVAPVVLPQWVTDGPRRPVYLPSGSQWYSFKDNRFQLDPPVEGGKEFDYFAPWDDGGPHLNNIPVYVRAGAIIPTREIEQYVGELQSNPVTLSIYPGHRGSYRLYLDDGTTTDAEDDGYRSVMIEHNVTTNGRHIDIVREHDGFQPNEDAFFLCVLDPVRPNDVSLHRDGGNASSISRIQLGSDEESADALWIASTDAFYFNEALQATFIKVFDDANAIAVDVAFSE